MGGILKMKDVVERLPSPSPNTAHLFPLPAKDVVLFNVAENGDFVAYDEQVCR